MAGWEGIGEREVSRPWSWRDRREGVVPPLELAGQVREGRRVYRHWRLRDRGREEAAFRAGGIG